MAPPYEAKALGYSQTSTLYPLSRKSFVYSPSAVHITTQSCPASSASLSNLNIVLCWPNTTCG
ncbi:hypothetical protein [Rubritalea tangerina]|uniref:hypothetical protein n=1 Tax=Rubritalea tangerina TaxID=430798 RepID=UPI00361A0136